MNRILFVALILLSACGRSEVPAGYEARYADCVAYFGSAKGTLYCAEYYRCAAAKVPADQYPEGGFLECAK